MGRIWGVAKHTIAAAIRMRIAVVFMVLLVAALGGLYATAEGDGTLRGQVQFFLSVSLFAVSVGLSVMTLLVASWSLSYDITQKTVQTVVTKPIPRWQFIVGKWLGICVLNLVLLLCAGLFIYGAVRLPKYGLEHGPERTAGDRDRLHREVLTARRAVRPTMPTEAELTRRANEVYAERERNGTLPSDRTAAVVKAELVAQFASERNTVPPLGNKTYIIEDLRFIDRSPGAKLYIRYKPTVTRRPPQEILRCYWFVGDPRQGATAHRFERKDKIDVYQELAVPVDAVGKDENGNPTLVLTFFNQDRSNRDPQAIYANTFRTWVTFEQGIELLYGVGSFEGNFGRALAMLYCWLVFLAALGLFASSFLSFPVACMLCILIYTVGMGAGFFTEAVDNSDTLDPARDPFGMAGPVFRLVGFAFLWVVPDFAFYDPAPRLVDGRLVSLVWLLRAVGLVAVARTVVIGALACVLFHRRELAEVVV